MTAPGPDPVIPLLNEVVPMTLQSAINTVSRDEVWGSSLDREKFTLRFARKNKVFTLSPQTLGLESKKLFLNGNVPAVERTIKAVMSKALWFQGGYKNLGPEKRPDFKPSSELAKPFPLFVYPSEASSYEEIRSSLRKLVGILKSRWEFVPNCIPYVNLLEAVDAEWDNLKEGGLKRALFFVREIAKSVRSDGVDCTPILRHIRSPDGHFKTVEGYQQLFFTSPAWKNIIKGHSKGVTELKGPILPMSPTGSVKPLDSGPVIDENGETTFEEPQQILPNDLATQVEYFENCVVDVLKMVGTKLSESWETALTYGWVRIFCAQNMTSEDVVKNAASKVLDHKNEFDLAILQGKASRLSSIPSDSLVSENLALRKQLSEISESLDKAVETIKMYQLQQNVKSPLPPRPVDLPNVEESGNIFVRFVKTVLRKLYAFITFNW